MKKQVLFIGAFKTPKKSQLMGGQLYACTTLINSTLSNSVDFALLDTTATTHKKRSLIHRLFYAFIRIIKFIRIITTQRVDGVIAFTSYGFSFLEKGFILILSKMLHKKTVIAPRSGFLLDNMSNSKTYKWLARRILNNCDVIICQGQFWKDYFQTQLDVSPGKLVVINNWIDVKKYSFKINENTSPIQILFMGAIERNKGIFDLIPIIESLKNKEVKWTFAGEGNDMQTFVEMLSIKELTSKVTFKGWVKGDKKIKLLSDTHIVVIPSYREGLPNILLEAMASGCGIVVSDVGAVSDIIQNDINGFLIQPGNVQQLTTCIETYILHPQCIQRHAHCALKTVLDKNDIASVVPKFEKILAG